MDNWSYKKVSECLSQIPCMNEMNDWQIYSYCFKSFEIESERREKFLF